MPWESATTDLRHSLAWFGIVWLLVYPGDHWVAEDDILLRLGSAGSKLEIVA